GFLHFVTEFKVQLWLKRGMSNLVGFREEGHRGFAVTCVDQRDETVVCPVRLPSTQDACEQVLVEALAAKGEAVIPLSHVFLDDRFELLGSRRDLELNAVVIGERE